MYIFKKSEHEDEGDVISLKGRKEARHDAQHVKRVYFTSETGYMTADVFRCVITEFIAWWKVVSGGRDCYLLCDNLACHANDEIVDMALNERVYLWTIMPGSSYWFQVHDNLPFAQLKKEMSHLVDSVVFRSGDSPATRQRLVAGCFYKAEDTAFTPAVVRSAFKNVGLWPFDENLILSRAMEQQKVNEDDKMMHISNVIKGVLEQDEQIEETRRNEMLKLTAPVKFVEYDHSPLKKKPRKEDWKGLPAATQLFQSPTVEDRLSGIQKGTVCAAEGCQSKYRSSLKWRPCWKCGCVWCPKHAAMCGKHIPKCDH